RRVEILPHPSVHMVFEHSGDARVVGVAKEKFVRMLQDRNGVFGVKFRPGGFHPFFGAHVSSLADRALSIDAVFGAAGESLVREINAEIDDAGRRRVAEAFLSSRVVSDPLVSWIADIVYAVASDRTILKVDDLVERQGVNKRTLQRLFSKYVGATPKWVIQRYRLHEAAAQLAAHADVNHAALAASLGYSDQAHFVRDFQSTVGMSPARFARRSRSP
ncbi:MAG: AraC family transcriptional regulator, partial [Gemmatimonadetes bacterium]|nr:AraC family transcriptional regulator [Gemmatimonadota bacterium]